MGAVLGMAGTLLGQNGGVPNAAPDTIERLREDIRERIHEEESLSPEHPWVTIVWDDPINLMSYVTYVFQQLFQFPKPKAEKLMLDVHRTGKAVVTSGTREEMERDVTRLHGAGLWATLQHDR
jgi:ATP-dependent Clp protease adaptor protein ClpS